MANGNGLKHVMYGAVLQIGAKSASHITFNVAAKSVGGQKLRDQYPWFYGTGPAMVHYDDWILDLGLPAILGLFGIVTKKKNVMDMALGAGLTGVATFLNQMLANPGAIPIITGAGSLSSNSTTGSLSSNSPVGRMASTNDGVMFGEPSAKFRGLSPNQTTPIQNEKYTGRTIGSSNVGYTNLDVQLLV